MRGYPPRPLSHKDKKEERVKSHEELEMEIMNRNATRSRKVGRDQSAEDMSYEDRIMRAKASMWAVASYLLVIIALIATPVLFALAFFLWRLMTP